MCATCQAAKLRRRPTGAKHVTPDKLKQDILRADSLKPGDEVSMDQYESSVRGRSLPSSRGREYTRRCVGGTLIFDHASGKIFNRHQSSLSATATMDVVHAMMREAMESGVEFKKFRTDNGIFSKRKFLRMFHDNYKQLSRSAPGAHHQNGVAERAIGTVQAMARAMLLHVRIHWPDEFDPSLWPFALDYAIRIYNALPRDVKDGLSPDEIFTGMHTGCEQLRRMRAFGCPAYVLDPRLQDGKKIPKWKPRSRQGQFLGFSSEHSSLVAWVRNLTTNRISPQFHVVFDERFQTVTSEMMIDLEETWIDLFKGSREYFLEDFDVKVDGPLPTLDDEWKDPDDDDEVPDLAPQEDSDSDSDDEDDQVLPPLVTRKRKPKTAKDRPSRPLEPSGPKYFDVEENLPRPQPLDDGKQGESEDSESEESEESDQNSDSNESQESLSSEDDSSQEDEEPVTYNGTRRSKRLRRQARLKKNSARSVRFIDSNVYLGFYALRDPSNLAFATLDWDSVNDDPLFNHFEDLFATHLDRESCELVDSDGLHPFALASKITSEDFPTYREILRMDPQEREQWFDSMDEELQALWENGTFEFVDRSEVEKAAKEIVRTTWAFRKKRRPSGEVYRLKSRLCVRGDLSRDANNYTTNEVFAPVVEWATIRMLFSLSVMEDWVTRSIDFKNAFAQATLPEPLYLELPPGCVQANPESRNKVMKIKKSLYGDRRAANLWYKMIRQTLIDDLNFHVSEMDPCLFVRDNCIVVLYVDDAIIFARDDETVNKLFKDLEDLKCEFSEDTTFSSYLGIKIETRPDGSKKLSQPGLKRSVLDVMGLLDANPVKTPIGTPLFKFEDAEPFDQSFNYRSALGMLQYVGNNTHPECAYAINSCARYCVDPRKPHGEALKRIGRYMKGVMDEGLIIKPDDDLALDCWVDADFAGNYHKNDNHDPACVRSRTGFVITLGSVPVLWKSVIQTEIALSTMESEYIALSTAMRKLIQLRAILFEINDHYALKCNNRLSTISTVFEDNQACRILATTDPPRMTPRSKSLAVKYHWFRTHLSEDSIVIRDVDTSLQKGDGFTKPLAWEAFQKFRLSVCGW